MSFPRQLIALVVVTLAVSGCDQSLSTSASSSAPRLVDSVRVEPANGQSTISLTGKLRAVERTALSFEVSGEIDSLEVDVGDRITKGQTLASLKAERYRLVLEQARASEAEAEAALEEKRLDFERQRELRDQGYVSAASLDTARAAFATAQSRFQSAQASVHIAERDVTLTRLEAPFDGSISQRLAQPVQRVAPNEPVLEAISERGGFEVYTHVPEALVGHLQRGSEHPVRISAIGSEPLAATVEHIGTQPESSNNYPLVLHLENPDPGLRAGMTAQVLLQTEAAGGEQTFVVPMTALVYGQGDSVSVYRVNTNREVEAVGVAIVEPRDRQVSVTGALSVGDTVIARGAEFVQPGDKVALLGEGPERYN